MESRISHWGVGLSEDSCMNSWVGQGVTVLRSGGIILYPTDTIWGIGCDATDPEAVDRIYKLKQRGESKALLVLVDSVSMLQRYVDPIPEAAYAFLHALDRPTTVVYPCAVGLAPNLHASDGSVGVRLVRHPLCQRLIQALGYPLVSTSANIAGMPYLGTFSEIHPSILDGVALVFPQCFDTAKEARSSRVVKVSEGGGAYTILRE